MPEAGRPVRDRQAGIVAGDQPASDDQQKGQCGNKDSKTMLSCVVRG